MLRRVVWDKFTNVYEVLAALMMEAASTSETSVNIYQNTRRHMPEDSHLQDTVCFYKDNSLLVYKNAKSDEKGRMQSLTVSRNSCIVFLQIRLRLRIRNGVEPLFSKYKSFTPLHCKKQHRALLYVTTLIAATFRKPISYS
jgi:hypothetical protein